jgi:hypothetical protein
MLRYVARAAVSTAKWGGKKSMWAGLFAFIAWSSIEMYDGAHDRMQTRYSQAKETVVPPVENSMAWCQAVAEKLWLSIEHNPGPSLLAFGLFVFTIIYHKMHGKGLKEAFTMTVLRSVPNEPAKPKIIQKAENELLYEKLISTETTLESQIIDLPREIREALGMAETLQREAERAEEQAKTKRSRADAATKKHDGLVVKLDEAKRDLEEVREQLGRQTD